MSNGIITGGGTVANNYGATFMAGGAIVKQPNNSGTLAIQGILGVGGNVILNNASLLQIELSGTTPGTQYDQMNVAGTASLDGTLNVASINSFLPSHNDQFEVLTFASRTRRFCHV